MQRTEGYCILDIPGSFLHASIDENMVMFINGKRVKIVVHVALQIYSNIKQQNMLYYHPESCFENIESQGFQVKPYDPCVSTKHIIVFK